MLSPDLKHRYCWQFRRKASEIERLQLFQSPYSFRTWALWGLFWYVFCLFVFSLMTGEQLFPAHRRGLSRLFLWFQEKSLVCGLKTGSQVLNGVLLLIPYQEPWVPDQTADSSSENEEVGSVESSNSKISWF